ncbi:Class II abasic (AP) endonuclease [Gamsiella multidivaricata]|nr:Class II abasic (AP) endonuclease [Gamsiella multidivaricata]
MKFMTWNVNGIRALIQYHPYCDDLHKNYREILDYLDADVICLQETKITRSKLDTDLALVPGYESYWSFHRTKSGYSGVAIYIKDHIKLLAVEEGISGVLSGNIALPEALSTSQKNGSLLNRPLPDSALDDNGSAKKRVGGYPSLEGDSTIALTRFQELDNEGRGLILDFGFFVLFNLYCPNETDETRLPFKMDYYHLLEARVQELIKEGREVIVMGDMNVVPTELDHCDPAKWRKEAGEDDFTNTPPRRWFNSFLAPNGPMTDLFRVFHKDEPGAFTCWNTKINARPSNYGTRLDYILVTDGLLPWFKSCDRKPHVVGSDHCPVVAEMFTELAMEKPWEEQEQYWQKTQRLQDVLDSFGGTTGHALAARFFDEFSGKQQKLSAFFKKPSQIPASSPVSMIATTSQSMPSSPSQAAADIKRPLSLDYMGDPAPRKKIFFNSESSSALSKTSSTSTIAMTSTANSLSDSSKNIPRSASKAPTKVGTGRSIQDKPTLKKSINSKPSGQQSVLSFFSSSSKKSNDVPATSKSVARDTETDSQSLNQDTTTGSQSPSNVSSTLSQPQESSQDMSLLSLDSTAGSSSTFSPNDFADWIPGSQDVMPFSTNGESTTSKWQSLFQPKAVPKCRFHGVPCTEHTVSKKGPNKGRRFFSCSM